MNIQVNTGHNIKGNKTLTTKFSTTIKSALSRVSDHITRVEVHLKDEDGDKKGKKDKRCMIEAHLKGRKPIVVTNHADTLNQALDSAIDKLLRMIENFLGRQRGQRSRKTGHSEPKLKYSEES